MTDTAVTTAPVVPASDSAASPPPWLEEMPPRQIVSELDRYIVGQDAAKKAVAIAVRNRWRRAQAPDDIRDEITPYNIIMIGPTGVGKTEVARRLACSEQNARQRVSRGLRRLGLVLQERGLQPALEREP